MYIKTNRKREEMVCAPVIPSMTAHDKVRLEQAKAYLLEHIDERTSIAELSRIIGVNRNKLTAGFKQLYGITILDFVIDERMKKAKMLLLDTETPIQEIAAMIGYGKLSNFTTAFTRKVGVPPSIFRKKR